jgi:hypothetical protein
VIAATSVAPSVLHDALHACAEGCPPEEAAVGLVIAHGVWLARDDFLTTCVDVEEHAVTHRRSTTAADIDWYAARVIAARAEADESAAAADVAVLRVAASIAIGDLGIAAGRLDEHTIDLVMTAIAHVAGITGDFPRSGDNPVTAPTWSCSSQR